MSPPFNSLHEWDDLPLTRLTKPAIKSFCVPPQQRFFHSRFSHCMARLSRDVRARLRVYTSAPRGTWCFWHFGAARETSKGRRKADRPPVYHRMLIQQLESSGSFESDSRAFTWSIVAVVFLLLLFFVSTADSNFESLRLLDDKK